RARALLGRLAAAQEPDQVRGRERCRMVESRPRRTHGEALGVALVVELGGERPDREAELLQATAEEPCVPPLLGVVLVDATRERSVAHVARHPIEVDTAVALTDAERVHQALSPLRIAQRT